MKRWFKSNLGLHTLENGMYEYAAHIIRVLDGDTVEAVIDLGFHLSYTTKIRLAQLNAPELKTPEGIIAKAFLEKLINDVDVIVTTALKKEFEKYGRVLGVIIHNGMNINALMLANKMAQEVK